MNTSTYITFNAIDYKGENSLSSYSLPITPLIFVPELDIRTTGNIVWDFGDGTIEKAFSASKVYDYPGVYTVTMVQYDCDNNAATSSETKTITIYDYLPLTFDVTAYDNLSSISHLTINCGEIYGPLFIKSSVPQYQQKLNIFYDVKHSLSQNYWDIENHKFAHLEKTNCLYEKLYNYSISSFQYNPIKYIDAGNSKIYTKIKNNNIVVCKSTDDGACYAGMSGTKDVYFKDDIIKNDVRIDLRFDKTNYNHPNISNFSYLNNFGVVLSANIVDNVPSSFNITSNGLDGEGFPIDSFHINPIKVYGTKIPFVIKIKDYNNFTIKNYNLISLSGLTISVTNSGSNTIIGPNRYDVYSLNNTISSEYVGGSFRGYIHFPLPVDSLETEPLFNIRINVSGSVTNDQSLTYNLTGHSNYFSVYPPNYIDMFKINENFDAGEQLENLRFQEILLEKNVLFKDFFGGILGTGMSSHEDIGVKAYERISNFVDNTQDIDKCNVDSLNSIGEFMGYNDSFEEKYVYPERIKRLIDLLSIDKNKLIGYENKFNQNFDIRGRTSKEEYGVNLGAQIDPFTYVVNTSASIVALEKFSNEYTLLNTFQPLSVVGTHSYNLSSYSSDWGWPLVLPSPFYFKDIEKYYLFFEYNNQYEGSILDGVIDFNNQGTTLPSNVKTSDFRRVYGIDDHMFMDTMYQSLSLVDTMIIENGTVFIPDGTGVYFGPDGVSLYLIP